MKLQEKLPESVTVKGRQIPLDLDFRNVLNMMDILARDDLTPEAREFLALKCIMVKRTPNRTGEIMRAVRELLFPVTKKGAAKEKLTDFEQDADLIRAAFWQTYKINLYREKLHWFEFTALLHGLPEGSRYSDVIGIRARPMPKPTKYNAEERQWLAKAKAEYAVRLTDKEQENRLKDGLRAVAHSLLALSEMGGGGKNGG